MNQSDIAKNIDRKQRHVALFGFWRNGNSAGNILIASTYPNQEPRNKSLATGSKLKLPVKLNPLRHPERYPLNQRNLSDLRIRKQGKIELTLLFAYSNGYACADNRAACIDILTQNPKS